MDIGANLGLVTMTMLSLVGETDAIYAFEPNPRMFALLAESVARSGAANRVQRRRRLIKIDVEGHEPEVLRGAQAFLSEYPPDAVLFELNQRDWTGEVHAPLRLPEEARYLMARA